MQTVSSTLDHVRHAVAHHAFLDAADWRVGLDELARMTDDEIDLVASDGDFWPCLPMGVTAEQVKKDRATFERYRGLLGR